MKFPTKISSFTVNKAEFLRRLSLEKLLLSCWDKVQV